MGIAEQVVTLFPHNPVIAGVTSHGAMQSGHFVFRHTGKGETWLGPVNEAARATPPWRTIWRPPGQAGWMNRSSAPVAEAGGQLRHQPAHRALQAQEWRAGRPALCRCPAADLRGSGGRDAGRRPAHRQRRTAAPGHDGGGAHRRQLLFHVSGHGTGARDRIEAITGFLLARAASHGIAVPVNQGLYQAIKEKQ